MSIPVKIQIKTLTKIKKRNAAPDIFFQSAAFQRYKPINLIFPFFEEMFQNKLKKITFAELIFEAHIV
jgi:hypothetical protein